MLLIITFSIFACVTLGVVGTYWLISRPQDAVTERLMQLGPARRETAPGAALDNEPGAVAALAERVATPLNRLAPPSAAEARKLQKKLMQAGFRAPGAPMIYRAVQLIMLFSLPGLMVLGCVMLARPLNSALILIMMAVVAGALLPRFVLGRLIRSRQQRITWGMADALDLMVVSIEAGLGLNAAMVRISDELKAVHPELSEELGLANLEMRVGRERDEALRNLAERTGVEDLRGFVAMVIQADRFGTSIAQAVRVYSDSLRTRRRQRAEQAAQKAAVKLLFPLACFLFPTLFMAVLGPAALHLIDTFAKLKH
jgi:tight adherence protein C